MLALDPQALDRAAAHTGATAESLTCLDVTGPLRGAAEALPGSQTAAACTWTGAGIDAAVDGWASRLRHLAETAQGVSRDLVLTDEEVAGSLRTTGPERP